MQLDSIAVKLRPRSMPESADLGVRLVQVHARSVWGTCAPLFIVVFALALSTVEIASWLPTLLIFWLKPWLDRSVLFVLSRAVFGQSTRCADLWRAQRSVWWRQLPSTLLLRRLSPWRAFTQPIRQLEGQHGKAMVQRRAQLLRGQRGSALSMHAAFAHAELALDIGLLTLLLLFAPSASRQGLFGWLVSGDTASSVTLALAYSLVVLMLEPMYVAAGFAMYLNRRVQLEAWDIEQEFRRAF